VEHWTAVDQGPGSNLAWTVDFGTGRLTTGFKTVTRYARAVRGGLY
jgi:hypothetical protein